MNGKKGDRTMNIVSLSGGKDSTAMLLMMLERNELIHSVVYCDMGEWEFPEMRTHIEKLQSIMTVPFVRVFPKHDLTYMLTKKPVKRNCKVYRYGNNWPSAQRRWCTSEKVATINRYIKKISCDYTVCIGYACDEQKRNKPKENYRYPLIEYGVAENEALQYCYGKGFDYDGLYNIFNRLSCFCCPLQRISELRKLRKVYPSLWRNMLEWDSKIDTRFGVGFKGYKTVHCIDKRFAEEERQLSLF